MAKQVGLFNLRGKIENKSFYKTAGVPDTVIRQIPEGLSSRVKTAPEYANTRLNNDEFKNANAIATFLMNAVPNRRSSMMRRFAIADMTKLALEYIKSGSGNWGQRIPTTKMDAIAVDLLENRAKSGPYAGEFGKLTVSSRPNNAVQVALEYDDLVASDLLDKGIDGFYMLNVQGALAEVVDTDGFVRKLFGVSSVDPTDVTINPAGASTDFTFTPSPATLGMSPAGYTAAQDASNNGMYDIVSFIPYREIGSQRHTLYEYATYAALALGAIPTE